MAPAGATDRRGKIHKGGGEGITGRIKICYYWNS